MPDPTGTVVLVVGDVVGHGVHAAAVMAQLRTATRMQLSTGAGIGQSLEAVDRFAADVAGAKSATVCVVRLNPTTGDLDYCTAGHPPPLVIGTDGTPRYLEPTGAGPLGSGRGFATRTAHLGVGDVVLLYSDGIIERPGRSPSASTAEVAYVTARVLGGQGSPLAPPQAPVQRLCSQALELLVRPTGYSDDVTLLAAQRRLPPPPLHVVLRADAHAEPTMRTQLRSWLRMLGADHTSGDVLEHAVSELVTNAAEHAYHPTSPGEVMVDADLGHDGRVRASVADHGTSKPPTADGAGAGTRPDVAAQLLVPDTVIRHDQTGTTARCNPPVDPGRSTS